MIIDKKEDFPEYYEVHAKKKQVSIMLYFQQFKKQLILNNFLSMS